MIYTNSRKIPLHSLCIIVGPTNSGKTTLCNKKFPNYEILDPEKNRLNPKTSAAETKIATAQVILPLIPVFPITFAMAIWE